MVGHRLSARRGVGRALDPRRPDPRRDALAGAECRRLPGLRHGLERLAGVSRPPAQSAGAGSRRHCLGGRDDDAAAGGVGTAPDHRCGDRRDLCGVDRHRIVARAPPHHATALADRRGAGAAWLRPDAADPARRPAAPARSDVRQQHLGDGIRHRTRALRGRHRVRDLHAGVGARGDRAQDRGVDGSADRHVQSPRFCRGDVAGDRARSQCRASGDGC